MSLFLWIVIILIVLVALAMLLGMLMPRIIHVSRTAVIGAKPEDVFPHISDLRRFAKWSPWAAKDPDMTQQFNDQEGLGAQMQWSGNKKVGQGQMTITEIDAPNRLRLALDFGKMGTATAFWTLEPDAGGTRATWAVDADMGAGPVGRLFGPMASKMIGADYETGLANLKAQVEAD